MAALSRLGQGKGLTFLWPFVLKKYIDWSFWLNCAKLEEIYQYLNAHLLLNIAFFFLVKGDANHKYHKAAVGGKKNALEILPEKKAGIEKQGTQRP